MKAVFAADIHLEAGRDLGVADYGPGSRFDDQVAVLDRIADLAIVEECGVVAVVGDVFHRATPLPQSMIAFQSFVNRLLDAGIRVVVILGNHDVKSAALPTALDLWRSHGDMTLASSPRLIPVDDVVFACLPWTPMSVLVAQEGRSLALRDTATDLLIQAIGQLRLAADSQYPEHIPILLAHWAVSGSSLPNGLPVDQLSEPVIPWIDIDTLGWRLCALGHIHEAQLIAEGLADTPIFYTGSAAVTTLGEIGSQHGVWLWDSVTDELRFCPVEDRAFIDHLIDFGPEAGARVPLVLPAPASGAVVRVRYRSNGVTVDEAAIRRELSEAGAHKVFVKEIDRAVVSRSRIEAPAHDVSVTDALGLWVESADVVASRNGDGPRFLESLRERHLAYVERLGA
jgi:exonuclease SbcD